MFEKLLHKLSPILITTLPGRSCRPYFIDKKTKAQNSNVLIVAHKARRWLWWMRVVLITDHPFY